MKLLSLLTLLLIPLYVHADGVCKKKGVPPGYVATKSFYSPECDDEGDPFKKNAWEVAPTVEGITSCALPTYEKLDAKTAQFVRCEETQNPECDERLDGLANARIIRSPTECVKRKLPTDLSLTCARSITPLGIGKWGGAPTEAYAIIAYLTEKSCGTGSPNAYLLQAINASYAGAVTVCANQGVSDCA